MGTQFHQNTFMGYEFITFHGTMQIYKTFHKVRIYDISWDAGP